MAARPHLHQNESRLRTPPRAVRWPVLLLGSLGSGGVAASLVALAWPWLEPSPGALPAVLATWLSVFALSPICVRFSKINQTVLPRLVLIFNAGAAIGVWALSPPSLSAESPLAPVLFAATCAVGFLWIPALLVSFPVWTALQGARDPSMDAPDLAARNTGLVLLGWSLVGSVIVGYVGLCYPWTMGDPPALASVVGPLRAVMLAVGGLGAAAIAVAVGRLGARRAWLRRVLEGRQAAWEVRQLSDDDAGDAVPPLFRAAASSRLDGLILRRRPGEGAGPFRTGDELVPYATIKLPLARKRRKPFVVDGARTV